MKRIVLTGATGFVGRQVCSALLAKGYEVVGVARRSSDLPAAVEFVVTRDLFSESTTWWTSICSGAAAVVHCAWVTEPGIYLSDPRNFDCLAGTLALAQGAAAAGVRRFIGVGTCFEYDLSHRILSTDTPLRPATPYAASKAATFLALSQMLPAAGVSFAWARLFYLYGAGEDTRRLVPHLHAQLSAGKEALLTDGRQIRDYLDVADAGQAIARLADNLLTGPVNICSGVPVTVRELATDIAMLYGRPDLLRFGARPNNLTDPDCVLGVPTETF